MRVSVRKTSRKVDLDYLDPKPTYTEDNFTTFFKTSTIERWQELGSSRNRTARQILLTAQTVAGLSEKLAIGG